LVFFKFYKQTKQQLQVGIFPFIFRNIKYLISQIHSLTKENKLTDEHLYRILENANIIGSSTSTSTGSKFITNIIT